MKFFKSVALAASLAVSAVAADAATYTINSVINSSANGFGSSLFHTQSSHRMGGSTIIGFSDTATTTGAWSTDIVGSATSDNIYFSSQLQGGGTVDAIGFINLTSRASGKGLTGELRFNIAGAGSFSGMHTIKFDDQTFVSSSGTAIANAFLGTLGTGGELGLWGDKGNFAHASTCNQAPDYTCVGLDLRLGVTEGGEFNPPPVPLPAAGWLLLAGLGGLAATRRKKS